MKHQGRLQSSCRESSSQGPEAELSQLLVPHLLPGQEQQRSPTDASALGFPPAQPNALPDAAAMPMAAGLTPPAAGMSPSAAGASALTVSTVSFEAQQAAAGNMMRLMMQGRPAEALAAACSAHLWGPAMQLANSLGPQVSGGCKSAGFCVHRAVNCIAWVE